MRTFFLYGLFLLGLYHCHNDSKLDYHGVWLNHNLDYLKISEDSVIIATVYSDYPHQTGYSVNADTLITSGSTLLCKKYKKCIVKFHLLEGKIKPLISEAVSKYFFTLEDSFVKESERFSMKSFDSLIIERSKLTTYGIKTLSRIRINNSRGIKWCKAKEGKEEEYSLSLEDWENLKLEIMKIDNDQFKLWNEGEIADGYYLKISIFRGTDIIEFNGSMIPFYYKILKRVTNDIEILRIKEKRRQ